MNFNCKFGKQNQNPLYYTIGGTGAMTSEAKYLGEVSSPLVAEGSVEKSKDEPPKKACLALPKAFNQARMM